MTALADQLDAAADTAERLRTGEHRATVNPMESAQRIAISDAKTPRGDAFLAALHGRGYTLRSLAAELGLSAAYLSMARSGVRRLSDETVERIERLTGYRWPKL